MHRVLAILGAATLLFVSVGGAAANAPFKQTENTHDAGCFDIGTPLGSAEFSGYVSDLYGARAGLVVGGVAAIGAAAWGMMAARRVHGVTVTSDAAARAEGLTLTAAREDAEV